MVKPGEQFGLISTCIGGEGVANRHTQSFGQDRAVRLGKREVILCPLQDHDHRLYVVAQGPGFGSEEPARADQVLAAADWVLRAAAEVGCYRRSSVRTEHPFVQVGLLAVEVVALVPVFIDVDGSEVEAYPGGDPQQRKGCSLG